MLLRGVKIRVAHHGGDGSLSLQRIELRIELDESEVSPGNLHAIAEGRVRRSTTGDDAGLIEITIPETGPIQEFTQRLQGELEGMGYVAQELDEDAEEDS